MTSVMHDRRKGKTKVGTPELPPLQPQGGMILPNGTDLRHVTVLSKSDWERIQNQLYQHQIEEARLQRIRNEREEQKQRSKDMVKNWGNTIAGKRQQKLVARRLREEREEEEKQQIDIEEAQFQAAQRREAIDKAKTLQYYQTDRVKAFHSALMLTEVLKEREAQVELAKLKAEAAKGQDKELLEQTRREHEHALLREQNAAYKRMQAAKENAGFVVKQIGEHLHEHELSKMEDQKEGEELKKLSIAYEREKERLEKIKAEERLQTMRENKQQIEDVQKMKKLHEMQEEEEDEECRIFATAKKKMMRLRAEKEKQIYMHKQHKLDKIREKLAAQMRQTISDEEERIERAQRETEEKHEREEAEKAAKSRKMIEESAKHRLVQMKEAEDKLKEARREELEQLQLRKAADEVFQQNEMEKMGLQHEEIQKQKEFLFSQMEERRQQEEGLLLQQRMQDKANLELLQKEEQQFQEYAKKVIDHCEQGGRNTYPLRKAAKEGSGGGLGPVFPGKGGLRPSYMTQDKSGVQLPHYQRSTTEDIKRQMFGKSDTKNRLGFVW